jgi:predicted metalloprotease
MRARARTARITACAGVAVLSGGLVAWSLGLDPRLLMGGAEILSDARPPAVQNDPPPRPSGVLTDKVGLFVSKVLGSTEDAWQKVFAEAGQTYQPSVLVLYAGVTRAACGGIASRTVGPFYCAADRKVYLDTSFFNDLATKFHGCDVGSESCQLPQAYIIAHEIGHHVQNLLGILPKVRELQRNAASRADANHLSMLLELQADCLAGIWAHQVRKLYGSPDKPVFTPEDIEAVMRAVAALGNDRLQMQQSGHVIPDSFTHGSSEQRARWFAAGLNGGTLAGCNTFREPQ